MFEEKKMIYNRRKNVLYLLKLKKKKKYYSKYFNILKTATKRKRKLIYHLLLRNVPKLFCLLFGLTFGKFKYGINCEIVLLLYFAWIYK